MSTGAGGRHGQRRRRRRPLAAGAAAQGRAGGRGWARADEGALVGGGHLDRAHLLREVLHLVAIYAGLPTANTAFARAKAVFAEADADARGG